jgi:membrane protease subunit HflC
VLGVVFLFLLFSFQVRQSEVVLKTTFGRPTREYTEPGLKFRWPWGIQMIHRFDKRVQNFEDRLTEGLTRDGKNLLTSVYVGWKITDPSQFFTKFGAVNPIAEAEKRLAEVLGNAKSSIVGMHPLTDFVSATDNGTNFVVIEDEILNQANALLRQTESDGKGYGLKLEFLGIKKLGIPDQVTQQVFDEMTKERQVLVSTSQAEGDADASKIKSDADRKAAEMLAKAEGEATRIRGEGEGEAAKYLSVFQQNPELASLVFRLNALEGSLKERSILVFDRNTPPFDLFQGGWTNVAPKSGGTAPAGK